MAKPFGLVSVLVAVEFVATSAVLLVFLPVETVVPFLPLALVFLVALHQYWSSRAAADD